jgi:hypothetical protein
VNVNANGTGVVESVPLPRTRKTRMWLSLAFVVTISFRPLGVKPTWSLLATLVRKSPALTA